MSITKEQVVNTLNAIIHPEKGKSIIELQLVKELQVSNESIGFKLEFDRANDPAKSSIKRACEDILHRQYSDVKVRIELSTPLKIHQAKKEIPMVPGVKNIIAIASGKGGVGKSTVAANMAAAFAISGAKVGLIDADIYGPSIPKMFGVEDEKPAMTKVNDRDLLIPVEKHGVKLLSIGFFVDRNDATIWRGPMASNAFQQMLRDTNWGELDYLFVDLPPGTSDIHLTLVQSVPVTGALIVGTPQQVALADVIKGINMFRTPTINVPVLGIVENMSWFTPAELPNNKYYIFGTGNTEKLAVEMNVRLLGQIPLVQSVCESGDAGSPSVLDKSPISEAFKSLAENLRIEIIRRNAQMEPTQKVEFKK